MNLWNRTKEALAPVVEAVKAGWFARPREEAPGRYDPQRMLTARLEQARAVSPIALSGQAMDDSEGGQTLKRGYGSQGEGMIPLLCSWFLSQGFIGHQLAAFVATHWLVDKACSMPAKDCIRNGFNITTDAGTDLDDKVLRRMRALDKRFNLDLNLLQMIRFGRVFGIRIVLFKVESTNARYYELPFNIDGVTAGSYKGMIQVDPYWCAPELDAAAATDPASMHFYEPTHWLIGGKRYHRSHLVIFRNGDVPDILKPQYMYGGVSVVQRVMERVYAAERTANEAPQLAMTKRTTVFKTDLAAAMMDQEAFDGNLADWVKYRDNYAVKLIGEGDEMEQHDTSLADLDAVIMSQYQIVAAAAGVPATKLLGTSPKGFNATGEFEMQSYHEELESLQALDATPLVERHHLLTMKAFVAPELLDGKTMETTIAWNPLDAPTADDLSKIQLAKAQTGVALVSSGAIDSLDERNRIRNDKDSGYHGIAEATPAAPLLPEEPVDALGLDSLGLVGGAFLVTNQTHLDADTVREKIAARDFRVQVTPRFPGDSGKLYRVVIDGHHSLAAANACGVEPEFVEGEYGASDYKVLGLGP